MDPTPLQYCPSTLFWIGGAASSWLPYMLLGVCPPLVDRQTYYDLGETNRLLITDFHCCQLDAQIISLPLHSPMTVHVLFVTKEQRPAVPGPSSAMSQSISYAVPWPSVNLPHHFTPVARNRSRNL